VVWEILRERVEHWGDEFSRFIKRVVDAYGGRVTLVLFGSRARGDHDPASDYDVIVVIEDYDDYFEEVAKIRRMGRGIPIDLVLFRRGELVLDGVLSNMLRGCVTLFDGLGLGLCAGAD